MTRRIDIDTIVFDDERAWENCSCGVWLAGAPMQPFRPIPNVFFFGVCFYIPHVYLRHRSGHRRGSTVYEYKGRPRNARLYEAGWAMPGLCVKASVKVGRVMYSRVVGPI